MSSPANKNDTRDVTTTPPSTTDEKKIVERDEEGFLKVLRPPSGAKLRVYTRRTPSPRPATHVPSVRNLNLGIAPEVTADTLLENFSENDYTAFSRKCFKDREALGRGESAKMASLYTFWGEFLKKRFNKHMYMDFRNYAKDDYDYGEKFGMHCLLEYYSEGLMKKFYPHQFYHFQKETYNDYQKGNLYGLEKFWTFLQNYNFAKLLKIDHKLKKILKDYKSIADFRDASRIESLQAIPPEFSDRPYLFPNAINSRTGELRVQCFPPRSDLNQWRKAAAKTSTATSMSSCRTITEHRQWREAASSSSESSRRAKSVDAGCHRQSSKNQKDKSCCPPKPKGVVKSKSTVASRTRSASKAKAERSIAGSSKDE